MVNKVRVGLMGAGNIAPQYIKGLRKFEIIDLVSVADIDTSKAQAIADDHNLKASSVDEMLASDVEIIVNLTVPKVHAEVDLRIIEAGKSVYAEKPLGVERAEGEKVLAAAKEKGVLVGSAPDTFLGGGAQTCRKLIDDGWIGKPVAATAFLASRGPESWHPNPDFFYKFGGGPMFDMGPYYITALVNLLGPIKRVMGSARISFPERIATSEALFGHRIQVEIPTHISGTMDFASGAVATMITSFDVWRHELPRIEIYGSEGTISVPDPNTFKGPVRLWTAKEREWREIPLTHTADVLRGIGVADMAYAMRSGRAHRASGDLAFHVLDVMQAFGESSDGGRAVKIKSRLKQPAPLPIGLLDGRLDE